MKKGKVTELLIFVIATELIGFLSSFFAGNTSTFYDKLTKPPLSPPGWIFPIIWAILYALMGISAFFIFSANAKHDQRKSALVLYGIQLFVIFSWSIVFFRFEQIGAAFGVVLLLLLLVFWMLIHFWRIYSPAAYLNIPYLLWLLFATYLNLAILLLN